MKKYFNKAALFFCGLNLVIFFNNWWDFFGLLGFLSFFSWNIYAYNAGRNMFSLPKMSDNVKANGNPEGRLFLFLTSWILAIIFSLAYMYKGIIS